MRFPEASTAGMVPEELCRPTCGPPRPVDGVEGSCRSWGHPHLLGRQADSTGPSRAPTSSWGAALTSWTPERLPRRLARPELDNAVFASVLQPLAN